LRADHCASQPGAQLQAGGQITAADALLIVLVIGAGLLLDRTVELPVQATGSVIVWAVMLRLLHRARGDLRVIIIACLAWSSFGEVFASLIWGLYKYRLYNIPMFVPPGHVLMLLLALFAAERWRRLVLTAAPVIAVSYAVFALSMHRDMFSVLLTPLFVATLLMGRRREVYSATFLLAVVLELYGTWLGNWRWADTASWLDLSMANPPICIGALYCLRDVLSGATLSWIRGWKQRRQEEDIAEFGTLPAGGTV